MRNKRIFMGRKDRELMMKDSGDEKGQNSCCIQRNFAFQRPEDTDSSINSKYQGTFNAF